MRHGNPPLVVMLYCRTSMQARKKRKEKTTLLSVIEEKPMVNLSFPLA